jgi:hypothetical protein
MRDCSRYRVAKKPMRTDAGFAASGMRADEKQSRGV